jgi:uncharacterized protein (DUF362 family)
MRNAQAEFSRRELLAGIAVAGGAAVAEPAGAAPAPSAPTVPVSVAKVASYDEDLAAQFEKMFDQLGGIGQSVRGKTVAMKLNLSGAGRLEGYTTSQLFWVHPRVVLALTTVFGRLGAKRIRILESTGRKPDAKLEDHVLRDGWDVNAIKNAAPLVEFESTNGSGEGKQYSTLKVKTRQPYVFPAFSLNHSYEDCDFFVSVGKMKNHEEMGITLSMKNLFGITPDLLYGLRPIPEGADISYTGAFSPQVRERVFHYGQLGPPEGVPQEINPKSFRYEGWRLPRVLVDICGARPIDLAIVDGIEAAVGGEVMVPHVKHAAPKLLVVGRNCVCTDAVACATMGYDPRAGRHEPPFRVYKSSKNHPPAQINPPDDTRQYADNIMLLAEAVGMGSADLKKIEVRGVPIKDAVFDYEAYWKGQERS